MAEDFRIEDHSAAFLDALEKEARKVMNRIGNEAVSKAKILAPYKTGKLRDSIKKKISKIGDDLKLEVGASDFKANWFEFGTEKMQKKEFIGPATKDLGEEFNKGLIEAAKNIKVD